MSKTLYVPSDCAAWRKLPATPEKKASRRRPEAVEPTVPKGINFGLLSTKLGKTILLSSRSGKLAIIIATDPIPIRIR
jgi:hypothetical protein